MTCEWLTWPVHQWAIIIRELFFSFDKLLYRFYNYNISSIQGTCFELDEEMCADDDDREGLQEIINNSKLNEGYLTLARDIEVMEPKSPEDIYKVWLFFSLR